MGVELPSSVDQWLVDNDLMPPSALRTSKGQSDDTYRGSDIRSDPDSLKAVVLTVSDIETMTRQLTSSFKCNPVAPPGIVSARFAKIIAAKVKSRIAGFTFDRRFEVPVPRLEVSSDRYGTSAERSSSLVEYEKLALINPVQLYANDKIGFCCFLARTLASIFAWNKDMRYPFASNFCVLSPDNKVYGTPTLCHVLESALVHAEGDTRIPVVIRLLKQTGFIDEATSVLINTNDFDVFWVPASVGKLAALHYQRPDLSLKDPATPKGAKAWRIKAKQAPLDLIKLRTIIDQRVPFVQGSTSGTAAV